MSNLEKKLSISCEFYFSKTTVTAKHRTTGECVEVPIDGDEDLAKRKAVLLLADKLGRKEPVQPAKGEEPVESPKKAKKETPKGAKKKTSRSKGKTKTKKE